MASFHTHGHDVSGANDYYNNAGGALDHENEIRRPGRKIDVMSDEQYKRQGEEAALKQMWQSIHRKELERREAFFRHATIGEFQENFKAEKGKESSYKQAFEYWARETAAMMAVFALLKSPSQIDISPPINMEKKDIVAKFGSLSSFASQMINVSLSEKEVENVLTFFKNRKSEEDILKDYFKRQSEVAKSEPDKTILATLMKDAKIRDKIISKMSGAMVELNQVVDETAAIRRQAAEPYATQQAEHFKQRYEETFKRIVPGLKRLVPEERGKNLAGISYEKQNTNSPF